MRWLTTFWSRVMAGAKAFREAYFSTEMDAAEQVSFSSFEARRLRYAVLWAYFENTAYRDIHAWAKRMRVDYGLYQYVRNIYNPAYRIGDFWGDVHDGREPGPGGRERGERAVGAADHHGERAAAAGHRATVDVEQLAGRQGHHDAVGRDAGRRGPPGGG